jgi:2-polyprenyl-3-methyl-5-hydroxy-6-metoxy-1,4-benzoquinol methylase
VAGLPPEQRQALLKTYREGQKLSPMAAVPLIKALRENWPPSIEAAAVDEMIAELLVNTPIHPRGLERALTVVRRRLLVGGVDERLAPFVCRLAIQGHLNEYVWDQDAQERSQVEAMAARLPDLTPIEVMLVASYRPLGGIEGGEVLLTRGWGEPFAAVLREQLEAVAQERVLAAEIETLSGIRAGVSEAVRAQYEAHPYPRWRTAATLPCISQEASDILIAGCGTGYQAINRAQRYPNSRVLAVDLSRASLAYGLRKSREAGCANITFLQGDLLELGGLERRFDIIECTGVLHHMADPFEGARTLAALLKPGGVMPLALYSAMGRERLAAAKSVARRFTPETIRELRQTICAAPIGDPVRGPEKFVDFYAASSCRDLLMHVQEHELSVFDLQRIVEETGLQFLGFQVSEAVLTAYRGMFPTDPSGTHLANWHAFETAHPQTFSDMYQFWLRKAD